MQEVKDKVVNHVEAEAEQWLGSAMTYTLFQSVQEHCADLVSNQPDSVTEVNSYTSKLKIADESQQVYRTVVLFYSCLKPLRLNNIVFKMIKQ